MHVALILIVISASVYLVLLWANTYTDHGEAIEVPAIEGMQISDIEQELLNLGLTYEITDSVYSDVIDRGSIVSQNPSGGIKVKEGRTIFLTVNSLLPEMVQVPDLEGKSRRIAIPLIEIAGLSLDELKYQPDESCTDCVLGLIYQGKPIEAGEELRKGEKISLILGRQSNVRTTVPDIAGITYTDARELLSGLSLNMGAIIYCNGCETEEDTLKGYILNQTPNSGDEVKLGSFIDVYLTTDTAAAKSLRSYKDTTAQL